MPNAQFLYFASKLYDTHSRVPITDQHFISADKMRAEAEARRLGRDGSDPATRLDACLRWSLGTTAYDDYWMKGKVPLDELKGIAIHYDKRTFKRMTKADFQKHLGELLASPGAVTRRNVDLEAIVDYCRGPAHKPGSAPAGSAGGEESE